MASNGDSAAGRLALVGACALAVILAFGYSAKKGRDGKPEPTPSVSVTVVPTSGGMQDTIGTPRPTN